MTEGVWLLTDTEKSFIQLTAVTGVFNADTVFDAGLAGEVTFWKSGIHEKREKFDETGRNGTVITPSSKNQRLYCVLLVKYFLNCFFTRKRTPIIPLIRKLHSKKCMIKLVIDIISYLGSLERIERNCWISFSDNRLFSK